MGGIRRVVITGGPCGGKTVCTAAAKQALGNDVVLVPEASTLVMESGFPPPVAGMAPADLETWRKSFQAAILSTQRHLEETWEHLARNAGKRLILCDRGFLDGAAYWPGGRDAYLDHFNLKLEPTLSRYDIVVHLESVAVNQPGLYGTGNNHTRFENAEEAKRVDARIREAWRGHPIHIHIPALATIDQKAAAMVEALRRETMAPFA